MDFTYINYTESAEARQFFQGVLRDYHPPEQLSASELGNFSKKISDNSRDEKALKKAVKGKEGLAEAIRNKIKKAKEQMNDLSKITEGYLNESRGSPEENKEVTRLLNAYDLSNEEKKRAKENAKQR